MAKYDNMSFSKAFAAARKEMGKGKTFTWKGKSYTTDLKEDATAKKPKSQAVTAPPRSPMAQQRVSERAKYDNMSFSKAFAAARKAMGKGKTFTWRGKSYTTDLKEDAAAKTPKRQAVTAPPPRPTTGTRPVTAKVTVRDVYALEGPEATRDAGGRGTGAKPTPGTAKFKFRDVYADGEPIAEMNRSSTNSRNTITETRLPKLPTEYTYAEWKGMSRAERQAAGLPVRVFGGEGGFHRWRTGRNAAR